jgi:hypothetical protein
MHVAQAAKTLELVRFQFRQLARAAERFAKVGMLYRHILGDPARSATDRTDIRCWLSVVSIR